MFPFSFLAARALDIKAVCDLDEDSLDEGKFSPRPIKCQAIDHAISPTNSCYEKDCVNDRYHRFSKMSQATVWQPLSTPSLSQILEQFAKIDGPVDVGDNLQNAQPRGVYADMCIGEHSLRLQALVWSHSVVAVSPQATLNKLQETPLAKTQAEKTVNERVAASELGLLLVLRPMAGSYLPIGTSLTIAENNLLHSTPHLQWASHPSCLYTRVFGDWRKQFTVKILLPNALPKTLPSLTFES